MTGSSTTIPKRPWYVTMTDKSMSGWGKARNKTNKVVIGCSTLKQANEIERHAKKASEMIYVNVTNRKPYYDKKRYIISYYPYSGFSRFHNK